MFSKTQRKKTCLKFVIKFSKKYLKANDKGIKQQRKKN